MLVFVLFQEDNILLCQYAAEVLIYHNNFTETSLL